MFIALYCPNENKIINDYLNIFEVKGAEMENFSLACLAPSRIYYPARISTSLPANTLYSFFNNIIMHTSPQMIIH